MQQQVAAAHSLTSAIQGKKRAPPTLTSAKSVPVPVLAMSRIMPAVAALVPRLVWQAVLQPVRSLAPRAVRQRAVQVVTGVAAAHAISVAIAV